MHLPKLLTHLWRPAEDEVVLLPPSPGGQNPLCELVTALPHFLKWEWDEQTNGGLAILEVDAGERVLSIIEAQFPHQWNRKTLRRAPLPIRTAVKDLGGLRDQQRVFVKVLASDLAMLGLWWPWGHRGTISIRLVPCTLGGDSSQVEACRAQLMRAFRLT